MWPYFVLQLLIIVSVLHSLPCGGRVDRGEATFTSSANAIRINANGKAILYWDQFDIASHESVHFFQSQRSQAILNRVMEGETSQILGLLQANCPVFLINPQGVFIGSNACIDTAGFLASTANLSNEAFWQGDLCFEGLGIGRIVNLGAINSKEDVYLIARAMVVVNE